MFHKEGKKEMGEGRNEGDGHPSAQAARRDAHQVHDHPPPSSTVCGTDEHQERRLQDRDPLRPSFVVGVVVSVLMGLVGRWGGFAIVRHGAVSIYLPWYLGCTGSTPVCQLVSHSLTHSLIPPVVLMQLHLNHPPPGVAHNRTGKGMRQLLLRWLGLSRGALILSWPCSTYHQPVLSRPPRSRNNHLDRPADCFSLFSFTLPTWHSPL